LNNATPNSHSLQGYLRGERITTRWCPSKVSVLTLSLSNRIILRELIPLNLQDIKETMKVDLDEVSPEEIAEAEAFVKMLPPAKEELLNVSDYRTIGIGERKAPPKVIELEEIISRAKAGA